LQVLLDEVEVFVGSKGMEMLFQTTLGEPCRVSKPNTAIVMTLEIPPLQASTLFVAGSNPHGSLEATIDHQLNGHHNCVQAYGG
jgi:hypothetical protein